MRLLELRVEVFPKNELACFQLQSTSLVASFQGKSQERGKILSDLLFFLFLSSAVLVALVAVMWFLNFLGAGGWGIPDVIKILKKY